MISFSRKTAGFSLNILLKAGMVVALILVQPLLAAESIGISAVQDCRKLGADAERLLCYDTVVDGRVFNQQALEQVQADQFGIHEKQSDSSVDQLSVTIVRIGKSATGSHYFYTDDNKVWKHTGRGNWNLKVPFQAEIKSGTMGSFFLTTQGGKSARVKRVR